MPASKQEDGQIGAFLTLSKERALEQADRMDRMAADGKPLPPLGGVPVGIKDVMSTRGLRTTAGSKILENYIPPYDCTAVARLEAAGAVVLGKMNCDEFAMGSSNENSAYRPVRNPRDLSRVPGGSSGGSAAAVAADMAVATLGSDTGGSIRQPASFCGVVGLMPTYGRVSRYGLDRVCVVARPHWAAGENRERCGDWCCARLRDAIRWIRLPPTFLCQITLRNSTSRFAGLKIGVAKEYFGEGLDDEVRQAVEAAIQKLKGLGCEIVPVSLPHTQYAIPTYYLVATAEASSNLARYDGVRYGHRARGAKTLSEMYRRSRDEGFGAEVKRRIMLGTYALSAGYYDAYYLKAQKVRTLLTRDFDEAFRKVDAIVTPTSPTAAFRLGEKVERSAGDVLGGHLHRHCGPGRDSRDFGAVRGDEREIADRVADSREAL